MNIKDLSTLTIHKMASVEQFNREYAAGNIDDYAMYLVPEEQIDLSNYATIDMLEGLASDIATTATMGISNSTTAYVKISNFGDWGTGPWYAKGFSMLVTARAGETVWVSVYSDDSNTNARAIRLLNTYSKIAALHYSPSESALYVTANAWANNINAHILSNVNGDYVPSVAQASALPNDATAIPITELGPGYDTINIGNGVTPLRLTGSETRPMYNNSALAAYSDVQELRADVEQLKGASIAVLSGNGVPSASLGEDGDIYLVMG